MSNGVRARLLRSVAFVVTLTARLAKHLVAFDNNRSASEQWIKAGKGVEQMDRALISLVRSERRPAVAPCAGPQSRQFPANPRVVSLWPCLAFEVAEVAIPKTVLVRFLPSIAKLRGSPIASTVSGAGALHWHKPTGEAPLNKRKFGPFRHSEGHLFLRRHRRSPDTFLLHPKRWNSAC
jgi:hypothetical protein